MWGVNVKSDKEMPQNLFFENDVMIVDSGEEEPGDRSRMTIEIIEAQPVQINFVREKDGKQEVLPGIIERADGILKLRCQRFQPNLNLARCYLDQYRLMIQNPPSYCSPLPNRKKVAEIMCCTPIINTVMGDTTSYATH